MSIQDLRESRQAKTAECRAILDANPDKLPPEEKEKVDALMVEIDQINDKIEAEERVLAFAADDLASEQPNNFQRAEVQAKPVYANIGEQLSDVFALTTKNADAPKAADRFQKVVNAASGASTGIDAEGGYLVETDKANNIIETAIETGVFTSRCSRQPVGPNSDSFSYYAADDRDRSDGKINGVQVYRKGEATTMTQGGKATLEERELRLEDMYGLVYMTNRMLKDAPAMAAYTQRVLRKQLSFKLDQELYEGTGSGRCLGIMGSDALVTVAKETDQTADTIVAANILKMFYRFYGDMSKAAWFVNRDTLPQYPQMTIGNQPIFIPGGSFTNAPHGVLLGLPIVPVEFCETLGDKGDIILADWSEYLLIEKGGVEAQSSIHVKFLTDETAFRFIMRNNGQPIHDSAITPLNGSNTLSPFVTLAARA